MPKDTLENAAGEKLVVKLGGRDWPIRQFVLSDYLALRQHMKAERISTFLEGAKGLPRDERLAVLRMLAAEPVLDVDMMQESASMPGVIFMLWRQVRATDPTVKLEDMDALIADTDMAELMAIMEGLNAPDQEGSSGPLPETASASTTAAAS